MNQFDAGGVPRVFVHHNFVGISRPKMYCFILHLPLPTWLRQQLVVLEHLKGLLSGAVLVPAPELGVLAVAGHRHRVGRLLCVGGPFTESGFQNN